MNTKVTAVVAIVLIAAFSVGTGLVVHHNDQTNNTHAMMANSAMEKDAVMKAETSAAMKQKQSDEMNTRNAMVNGSSSTDSTNSTN
jgi:hypothetical protein